jgi:3-hydroxyisobutyrate dehydrogenase-like beta-hydroxyacid dehydrogenase
MTAIRSICLLGLGEVGTVLATDLAGRTDLAIKTFDLLFAVPDSKPSKALRDLPHVTAADCAAQAVQDSDLVISAVTAAQDLPAAESVLSALRPGAWFLDLNSVSPGTKCAVAERVTHAGGRYVEAAVMSPIAPKRIASPILIGGPHAEDFLAEGIALGFSGMRFCAAQLGSAAATKMCRSVIVKGTEALLSEALLAARHYGVEAAVVESLSDLFPRPDWREHARYMISRTLLHGTRRAEEMEEAARTVADAGIAPLMSEATVSRQAWAPQYAAALEREDLAAMLDAIRDQAAGQTQQRKPA